MEINLGAIPTGVISGIITFALTVSGKRLYERVLAKQEVFTGEWEETIPRFEDELEKQDKVSCTQIGSEVRARIIREVPCTPKPRKWEFVGRVVENALIGHYWAIDKGDVSFGTIFLEHVDRDVYSGRYTRFARSRDQSGTIVTHPSIPLTWKKLSS